jgi:hypothetical protein
MSHDSAVALRVRLMVRKFTRGSRAAEQHAKHGRPQRVQYLATTSGCSGITQLAGLRRSDWGCHSGLACSRGDGGHLVSGKCSRRLAFAAGAEAPAWSRRAPALRNARSEAPGWPADRRRRTGRPPAPQLGRLLPRSRRQHSYKLTASGSGDAVRADHTLPWIHRASPVAARLPARRGRAAQQPRPKAPNARRPPVLWPRAERVCRLSKGWRGTGCGEARVRRLYVLGCRGRGAA